MARGTVGDVPRICRIVQLISVDLVVVERRVALVGMNMTRQNKIHRMVEEKRLKNILAIEANAARFVLGGDIPRTMPRNDNPRCFGPVDECKVSSEPSGLLIHLGAKRAGVFVFRATHFVRPNKPVAEIRLGVKLDEVGHTMIKGIPEIAEAVTLRRGHAKVVAVASEVCLARHADAVRVGDVVNRVSCATVVAIRLVIARTHHVRLGGSDRSHLIIECIENPLVSSDTICNTDIGQVALDGLLEPVVGIGDVTG